MDLELTDEQTMLDEALTPLLQREWLPAEAAHTATPEQRAHLDAALREFFDGEELGAIELCLAARRFGMHLADTTFLAGATGTTGTLVAAAESVGAAERMLNDARDYAAERKQFGRTIGSYQALRHLLADMYVRRVSAWSTVLYAAAALDDDLPDAQQTASIAKAYVARAAREVAHGALQVFGGIAFTEEHQAHRFLRRILVRERQFGDAAYHERELGRALAVSAMERA
jgi:Acyl-CoA dehydrogenase, C-terminal domain